MPYGPFPLIIYLSFLLSLHSHSLNLPEKRVWEVSARHRRSHSQALEVLAVWNLHSRSQASEVLAVSGLHSRRKVWTVSALHSRLPVCFRRIRSHSHCFRFGYSSTVKLRAIKYSYLIHSFFI